MKMNKFLSLVLALAAGWTLHADLMYWTLDFAADEATPNPLFQYAYAGGDSLTARLVADNGSLKYNFAGDTLGKAEDAALGNVEGGLTVISGGDGYDFSDSSWSFYVELFNEATGGATVYRSDPIKVLNIRDSIAHDRTSPATIWNAATQSFSEVPEPTSGVLVLIGLGGLALRRRRV